MTYVDAETALSTLRREVVALIAENRRMREALRSLVSEVDFVISGGDDPHDACTECGLAGIGMLRDSRKRAIAALETKE